MPYSAHRNATGRCGSTPSAGGRSRSWRTSGLELAGPGDQPLVVRRPAQRARRGFLKEPHRVLEAELEALAVDRGEQLRTTPQPRPAIVVRKPSERRERGRNPRLQLLDGELDVRRAVGRGDRRLGVNALGHVNATQFSTTAPWPRADLPSRRLSTLPRLEPALDETRDGVPRLGVLAFGDSITNGGGELQWGVALQSWALWVARGLGVPFTGFAVDGARVEDLVDEQLPAFERCTADPGRALRPRVPVHRRQRRARDGLGRGPLRGALQSCAAVHRRPV